MAAKQEALEFISRVENENLEKQELFLELYNLYSGKDEGREIEPWLSNLQITAAFEFVERPFSMLAANTPSFEVVDKSEVAEEFELRKQKLDPVNPTEVLVPQIVVPWSEIYESTLDMMWQTKKMRQKLRVLAKGGLIYGTYHAHIRPALENEVQFKDIEKGKMGAVEKILPHVDLLEPFQVLVSNTAQDVEDALHNHGGYVLVYEDVSLDQLDSTYDTEELEAMLKERSQPTVSSPSQQKMADLKQDSASTKDYTFTVHHWVYVEDGKLKMVEVADKAVVIKEDELSLEGLVRYVDQEVPGEYWGIGEIQPIMDDMREENTIRNQRIDYNNRLLNDEWVVNINTAGVDPRQLISKPNNIVAVNGDASEASIRQLTRTSTPLAASGQDMDRIRRNMSTTTGSIDSFATGNVGGFTNTATGERIRKESQISRVEAKRENLEFAVAEIARKMLLVLAESTKAKNIPVFLRGKWAEVPTKDFRKHLHKHEVTVRSGSMNVRNSELERNEAIAMINLGIQAANLGIQPNFDELFRKAFSTFSGVQVDKVLPKEQAAGPGAGQPLLPENIDQLGQVNPNNVQEASPATPGGQVS